MRYKKMCVLPMESPTQKSLAFWSLQKLKETFARKKDKFAENEMIK